MPSVWRRYTIATLQSVIVIVGIISVDALWYQCPKFISVFLLLVHSFYGIWLPTSEATISMATLRLQFIFRIVLAFAPACVDGTVGYWMCGNTIATNWRMVKARAILLRNANSFEMQKHWHFRFTNTFETRKLSNSSIPNEQKSILAGKMHQMFIPSSLTSKSKSNFHFQWLISKSWISWGFNNVGCTVLSPTKSLLPRRLFKTAQQHECRVDPFQQLKYESKW